MSTVDKVGDRAAGVIEAIGKVYEKFPNAEDLMKLVENKKTEIRLKFENLTLDGDIALSVTLIKQEKGEE